MTNLKIDSAEQVPETVSTNEVPNAEGGIDQTAAENMAASSPKSINEGIQDYYTSEPGNVEVKAEVDPQTGGYTDETLFNSEEESLNSIDETESNFEYNTSDI